MSGKETSMLRRFLEFRLVFVANAVILLLLGLSFGREFVRNHEIAQDIALLEAQAQTLETRNLELLELNTAYQTKTFIEREARLKLGMKRPGEQVVVVKKYDEEQAQAKQQAEDERNANPLALLDETPGTPVANPTKWWYYFFDHSRFNAR